MDEYRNTEDYRRKEVKKLEDNLVQVRTLNEKKRKNGLDSTTKNIIVQNVKPLRNTTSWKNKKIILRNKRDNR